VRANGGKRQPLSKPGRGFKSLKTAYAPIKGFEVMHALRKGRNGLAHRSGNAINTVLVSL